MLVAGMRQKVNRLKKSDDNKPKIWVAGIMCDESDSDEDVIGGSQRKKSMDFMDILEMPEMHKPRMKKRTVWIS